MKPLPPEVSLGQLLDIMHGRKPKPVPKLSAPTNSFWKLERSKVRFFPINDQKAFAREWEEYKDSIPRKYTKFLAMVAESERKQEIARKIAAKRAKGKQLHMKRYKEKP